MKSNQIKIDNLSLLELVINSVNYAHLEYEFKNSDDQSYIIIRKETFYNSDNRKVSYYFYSDNETIEKRITADEFALKRLTMIEVIKQRLNLHCDNY